MIPGFRIHVAAEAHCGHRRHSHDFEILAESGQSREQARKSGPHSLYIQTAACEMPKILLKLI
jgi:hypothetical protein